MSAPHKPAPPAVLKTAEQTLVMLVDDSKMVRVKSSRLLAAHGFQVVTAVDGLDALRQLETCCPDLLITDVDMPEMDGFGLVNALRGSPRTQHIPLVMITSAEDRHREEALRIGVGLVMGKPYDEAALIAHIRSFKFFAKAEEPEALACA
jgi:CheY-like chemotaxis protein